MCSEREQVSSFILDLSYLQTPPPKSHSVTLLCLDSEPSTQNTTQRILFTYLNILGRVCGRYYLQALFSDVQFWYSRASVKPF